MCAQVRVAHPRHGTMFKLSIRRRRLSFRPKIGVEIHAQLNTTNKLFSRK